MKTKSTSTYPIVVSHYLTAALCFLALSVLFFFSVDAFSGHYFQPKILALTHLAALGWVSMIIFGALYQLLPVILQTDLYSNKLAWLCFALLTPGLILLIYCFWVFETGSLMQIGAILSLTGICFFGSNVFLTLKQKQQDSIHQEFIATACIWLVLTALLGTLLVFNFRFVFLPKDHLAFLKLHAHLGLLGWFLMLIIGVSTKLIPMFLLSKHQSTRLLSYSYYLLNLALLLFIIDGYYNGLNMKTFFIIAMAIAGLLFYFYFIYQCFKSRIRRQVDLPMVKTLLAVLMLLLAISILPFIVYHHIQQNPLAVSLTVFYGFLVFMGATSLLILGQTFKTLPFMVWVRYYEHLAGKVKTPLPADLVNQKIFLLQFIAFLAFLILFATGLICGLTGLRYAGALCLIVTALAYLGNVLHLLLHQVKITDHGHL